MPLILAGTALFGGALAASASIFSPKPPESAGAYIEEKGLHTSRASGRP